MSNAHMGSKNRIDDIKREAVAQAERLGHRLKRFDKYKDSEVYYSSFCARCSAYLRVTASGGSGQAVEEPCQRLCHCGQPLTPDDLDGKCVSCRGNQLTLYPKTSAVRAKNNHYIEYCRKKDRDFEPGPVELSDYFWCCQHCFQRLGPGYQGEPDEQGRCSKCAEAERIWAKRKADAIEAAGGLKAWHRKRLIKKLLLPVDCIACVIAIIFAVSILIAIVFYGVWGIWNEICPMLSRTDDTVCLIIIALSIAWVALRRKALNERPSDY
jgi:hypothetical protein